MNQEYSVQIIWSKEDGAYLAAPVELPGCMADGQTQEEALQNLRQVIAEWIEVAKEEGRPIPKPMSREDFERVAEASEKKFREQLQKDVSALVHAALQQLAPPAQQHGQYHFRGVSISRHLTEPAGSGRGQ